MLKMPSPTGLARSSVIRVVWTNEKASSGHAYTLVPNINIKLGTAAHMGQKKTTLSENVCSQTI